MAETTEPKKETVRIALPPNPGSASGPETVRINLPARPPLAQRPMPLASSGTTLMPPDSTVFAPGPRKETAHMSVHGLKKETARIGILPNQPSAPILQMKKTQSLSRIPETIPPSVPLRMASAPEPDVVEQPAARDIPMAFCWALLSLSAVILLIQIWTYFS
jgi:hypothetical protein